MDTNLSYEKLKLLIDEMSKRRPIAIDAILSTRYIPRTIILEAHREGKHYLIANENDIAAIKRQTTPLTYESAWLIPQLAGIPIRDDLDDVAQKIIAEWFQSCVKAYTQANNPLNPTAGDSGSNNQSTAPAGK